MLCPLDFDLRVVPLSGTSLELSPSVFQEQLSTGELRDLVRGALRLPVAARLRAGDVLTKLFIALSVYDCVRLLPEDVMRQGDTPFFRKLL